MDTEINTNIAMENRTSYQVQLEKFTGPLDLLLQLIEERNLEITEIALSEITASYLIYLEKSEIKPEELVDFLVIAATLILIKSKAILPTLEFTNEEKEEILDLTNRLELYRIFKDLSRQLKDQLTKPPYLFSREPWSNQQREFNPPLNVTSEILADSMSKLIAELLEEAIVLPQAKIKRVVTLEERIKDLLNKLSQGKEFSFSDLTNKADKTDVIITFLAILHLAKEKIIQVQQNSLFGELKIKTNDYGEK